MLDDIVASVRARLDPVIEYAEAIRSTALAAPPVRSLAAALTRPGLSVIAEIKRKSPSRGVIKRGLVPADQAASYEQGGARAVSVLTERDHFAGSLDDLRAARDAVSLPILRKDFIIHPAQVWESRAVGADAVLLIVAILEDRVLQELLETVSEAGLEALVEAHTAAEAEKALGAGAGIVGINNRDLETFEVDVATAERIRPLLGAEVVTVAESGVSNPADAARMAAAGFDGILVGEAAVLAESPGEFVASLGASR